MGSERQFPADSHFNLAGAVWTLPTGEGVLVCKKSYGGGFLLYQKGEWDEKTAPALEADQDGCVMRQYQYVAYRNPAWVVPPGVRAHAISP